MTGNENRARRLLDSAQVNFDEAAQALEAGDKTRFEELKAKGEAKATEAAEIRELDKMREAASAQARELDVAKEANVRTKTERRVFEAEEAGETKGDRSDIPTVEQLVERSGHIAEVTSKGFGKRDSIPEVVDLGARKRFGVERLFFDNMRERLLAHKREDARMSSEDREAWGEYVRRATLAKRAVSPITGGQTTAAGEGSDMLPETLAMEIVARMAYFGPNADIGRFTVYTNDTTGKLRIPTVTDAYDKKAARVAEATNVPASKVATSSIELNPEHIAVQIPLTDQLVMSGNVNLQAWLMREVPEWFGRAQNEWFTKGTGTNQPQGMTTAADIGSHTKPGARTVALTEKDIMDFLGEINPIYRNAPSASLQFNDATIIALMQLRNNNGERVFPLTADRRSVIFPFGFMAESNNELDAQGVAGTPANKTIGLVGALSEYAVLTLGGIRFERQRELTSYQFLVGFDTYLDGRPLVPQAFARLRDGS